MPKIKSTTKSSAIDSDVRDIKTDLALLKDDARTLKDDTVEYIRQKADEGRIEAKIKTAELKNAVSEKADKLTETSKEQMVRFENQIRMKPLQSIATAFVAGAVISYLMKRR